jgi:hypothetical protein
VTDPKLLYPKQLARPLQVSSFPSFGPYVERILGTIYSYNYLLKFMH